MMAMMQLAAAGIVLAATGVASQDADQKIYTDLAGLSSTPVVIKQVKPEYTRSAMKAGVHGVVGLQCVVLTDGTVKNVRVIRPLHAELDQQAIKAAKKWRFRPATKDSKPVNVQVEIEMTFTLRDSPKL